MANTLTTALGAIEKAVLKIYIENKQTVGGITVVNDIEKTMEVQFNPSSLAYFASSDPVVVDSYRQQSLKDMRFLQAAKPISGQLSFTLIFDEVTNVKAFATDQFTNLSGGANVTNLAKMGAGMVMKEPSVKGKLCALTELIVSGNVKKIAFIWNELCVVGTVSEIQTNFTMFSMKGEPIRGTVSLRIKEDVEATNNAGRITKAFKEVFKDNQADARSASQKVESLINLNI